jgi:hypothetical protein
MSQDGMKVPNPPVGRLVWGSVSEKRQKRDNTTNQPVIGQDGQPVMQISFGVAYPKADFQQHMWPTMSQEIATAYPNGVPGRFAYKYADGDGVDSKGVPYNQREGYAGCIVLAYTSYLPNPPPLFKFNPQTGGYDQIPAEAVKCGDYIAVGTTFKCVPAVGTNTPSVYVNPDGVEFVGYGPPIISQGSFDPKACFGGQPRALPPGASATPLQAPGAPGMPGPAGYPPQAPQQPYAGPAQPGYGHPPQPQYAAPPPAYAPPPMAPAQAPGGYPPQQPGLPPPAHDFVPNAMGQPASQPGYAPPPMAPAPAPGGYPPQQPYPAPGAPPMAGGAPGMPPGMMPPR